MSVKKKLYRVDMGDGKQAAASHSSGYFHVLAASIADAVQKCERDDEAGGKAVKVELLATDDVGLIR